jgi:hypothetical protein
MLTIQSCRTTKQQEIELPPKPQRQELQPPQDLKDYAEIIIYYEYLVEEWEAWGELVENIYNVE